MKRKQRDRNVNISHVNELINHLDNLYDVRRFATDKGLVESPLVDDMIRGFEREYFNVTRTHYRPKDGDVQNG